MNEQENVKVVEQFYTASRSDIQTILNLLSEDIDLLSPEQADIPFAGRYHCHEQVAQFFSTIRETVEAEQVETQEFIAKGDKVVVLGHERIRVKSNGRTCDFDWVHVFTLRNGKIVKIHVYSDTACIAAAFRGE